MDDAADLIRYLSTTSMFEGLSDAALSSLAGRIQTVTVAGGEVLMNEGDPADCVYLVRVGRLRAFVKDAHGVDQLVGEAGPGAITGEMALLTDEPRSATVKAARDTQVLRLSRGDFLELVAHHPDSLLDVTRTVVNRLRESQRASSAHQAVETIALLPVDDTVDALRVAKKLRDCLEEMREEVVVIDRGRVDGEFGPQAADADIGSLDYSQVGRWLTAFEGQRHRVLYVMDPAPSAWSRRCVRQADVVLIIAGSRCSPIPGPLEKSMHRHQPHGRRELVLIHPASIVRPTDTRPWLEQRDVTRHHHIRDGEPAHFGRLARLLAGRAVGVVLSGGGVRGMAHLGVLQALMDDGIPVDVIGGASSGSAIGAGYAAGLTIDEIIDRVKESFGGMVDYTFPAVSIARGARIGNAERVAVGEDTQIEDLWLGFFCVSADLSAGALRVFDRGPLWWAVRSSISIPGVFPPMLDEREHVLVDGAILNNLPVDVMRSRMDGLTIGIDLRSKGGLYAPDLATDGVISGWKVAARRVLPLAPSMRVPGIVETLLRASEISSSQSQEEADYMFRPPVDQFSVLDLSAADRLVEAGYRYARRRLDESPIKL